MFNDIKLNWPSHLDTRLPLDLPSTLAMRITSIGLALTSEPDDRNANFVSISWVLTNERTQWNTYLYCTASLLTNTLSTSLISLFQGVAFEQRFGEDGDGDEIWKGWALHNRKNHGHK